MMKYTSEFYHFGLKANYKQTCSVYGDVVFSHIQDRECLCTIEVGEFSEWLSSHLVVRQH